MKTGGGLELFGSYQIDEEEDSYYFKFTDGWGEFVVKARVRIDDLIVVQVKVMQDYIRLIVDVITGNFWMCNFQNDKKLLMLFH